MQPTTDLENGFHGSDENKENELDTSAEDETTALIKLPVQPTSSQKSASKDTRDCPQTPLGRLPLSQLLGNGDENRPFVVNTPMERVLWENSPINVEATNSSRKRKRKRAYSASPSSSSQLEPSDNLLERRLLKVPKSSSKPFETPQTDPADDLWSRYSLYPGTERSPSALACLPLPSHLHSSSPQSASNPPRDGSLRRALSCIEWPTSAAKRRKMHHDSGERKSAAAFAELHDSGGQSKMSRVSFLVEKMHSGLSKPGRRAHFPSSEPVNSSPTAPRRQQSENEVVSSQSADRDMEDVVQRISQSLMSVKRPQSESLPSPSREPKGLHMEEGSDEFGDGDLDDDMFDFVDSDDRKSPRKIHAQSSKSELPSALAHHQSPIGEEGVDSTTAGGQVAGTSVYHGHNAQPAPQTSHNQAPLQSDSEFDDEEAENFAADLEEVFTKYETQQSASVEAQRQDHSIDSAQKTQSFTPAKSVVAAVEVFSSDDDDTFGNDSDFEQLAAECADATQTVNASQNAVRSNLISILRCELTN